MSAIADFISGTVNESLKKLLQPVGLIPAALFVLLNLAFIYPTAHEDKLSLATAFAKLDAAMQAAVLGLLTLALGYFLLSASGTILDIVGGQLLRGSVIHAALVWLQGKRRDYLLQSNPSSSWYVAKRFDLPRNGEDAEPLPTALGNVLVATQGRLQRRYGWDMAAFWSQLVATPELKEAPARGVVEDERAARDTLANTAFVLWLFALEGLVFFTFQDQPEDALLSLIALPAGYVVYRFAVAKAHSWGSAAETFVDLHRSTLHSALKLEKYGSLGTERDVWERAGRFFVATDDEPGDDVFQWEDAPSVTAIPAGDVTIPNPVSAVVEGPDPTRPSCWLRWIEYVILVAKKSKATAGTATELLVADPRVARIASSQGLGTGIPDPHVVRGSDRNHQLLWRLELEPGAVISLRYALPLFALHGMADETEITIEFEPWRGVGFLVAVPDDVECLVVTCFASKGRPQIHAGGVRCLPESSDAGVYEWAGLAGKHVWLVLPGEEQT